MLQYVEEPFDDGFPEEVILDAGAIEEETDLFHPVTTANDEDEDDDSNRLPNLHPDDPANFFKLSAALDILLARTLAVQDVATGGELLRAYCKELIHVSLSVSSLSLG